MSIYRSDNVFQRLDLSLLRYFFAIASFGGFSKASRATGISQPALSLGLQKLEKTLGTRLIDRRPGSFVLTDSGRVVQDYCKRLEGTLESMVGDLGGGTEISGPRRIRIGTGLSIGFAPLVRACSEATRMKNPLELELTTQVTYDLLSAVGDGTLDAALVPSDVYDQRLKIAPLYRDKLIFVSSPDAKEREITDFVLVTYPRETPMRSNVDRICNRHRLRFKSVISVNGVDGIVNLVRRGVGGAFVLKTLVAEELKHKELREVKVSLDLPSSDISLATAHGDHGDEVAALIRKLT